VPDHVDAFRCSVWFPATLKARQRTDAVVSEGRQGLYRITYPKPERGGRLWGGPHPNPPCAPTPPLSRFLFFFFFFFFFFFSLLGDFQSFFFSGGGKDPKKELEPPPQKNFCAFHQHIPWARTIAVHLKSADIGPAEIVEHDVYAGPLGALQPAGVYEWIERVGAEVPDFNAQNLHPLQDVRHSRTRTKNINWDRFARRAAVARPIRICRFAKHVGVDDERGQGNLSALLPYGLALSV